MNDTAPPPPPYPTASADNTRDSVHERNPDYAIYKPNSRGSGGVIRFGLNRAKAAVFLDAASQSGEKQFN